MLQFVFGRLSGRVTKPTRVLRREGLTAGRRRYVDERL
jgi:hypothetical protein